MNMVNMEELVMRTITLALLICVCVLLSGCLAAIPLIQAASLAASGAVVVKGYRTSTGGSVSVAFPEETIPQDKKTFLTNIKKLAIWPDSQIEVRIAEVLQEAGQISVVTPGKTGVLIRKLELPKRIASMTKNEMILAFRTICDESGADALLTFKSLGGKTNMNMFSFSRTNHKSQYKMFIYSRTTDDIAYTEVAETTIEIGGSMPGQQEILQIYAKLFSERLLTLMSINKPHEQVVIKESSTDNPFGKIKEWIHETTK